MQPKNILSHTCQMLSLEQYSSKLDLTRDSTGFLQESYEFVLDDREFF
jgi:hypothetical protein